MEPLVLIGIDLALTAVLILLVSFYLWRRRGTGSRRDEARQAPAPLPESAGLEACQAPEPLIAVDKAYPGCRPQASPAEPRPAAAAGPQPFLVHSAAAGRFLHEALELKRKGLSARQIARQLKASTAEIEMVLAFRDLEGNGAETASRQAPILSFPGAAANI